MSEPNPAYNYLVRLRPLDYYFFGGEVTFGNNEQQNYYARTQPLPQQTSILGVLRHLGYGKTDIGDSFDAGDPAANVTFGYINRISPLFLYREKNGNDHFYLPGPLGYPNGKPFQVLRAGAMIEFWNGETWTKAYQAPSFKAKDGWDQRLVTAEPPEKERHAQPFSKAIKPLVRVGITKPKDRQSQKDGFYKQEAAKLDTGWEFAVLADLDEDKVRKLEKSPIMPFGAEKALFRIQLDKLPNPLTFKEYFPDTLWDHKFSKDIDHCMLLLSDAWVSGDIYARCNFAISESKDFRNIRTPEKVVEFARFYQHLDRKAQEEKLKGQFQNDRLYKSAKYNLLRRGSLFYGKAGDIEPLLDQTAFQAIGYNHYTKLTSK